MPHSNRGYALTHIKGPTIPQRIAFAVVRTPWTVATGIIVSISGTLVLPCFGGGILENGTETQTQEQYSTHEQHKRRDHFRHQACRRNLAALIFGAGELDPVC